MQMSLREELKRIPERIIKLKDVLQYPASKLREQEQYTSGLLWTSSFLFSQLCFISLFRQFFFLKEEYMVSSSSRGKGTFFFSQNFFIIPEKVLNSMHNNIKNLKQRLKHINTKHSGAGEQNLYECIHCNICLLWNWE